MLVVMLASWPLVSAAECITIPVEAKPKAPPPPRAYTVAGAFCGRLFDELGQAPPGTEFWLLDKDRKTIATTIVDDNSGFHFPPVPRGDYWVGLVGFNTSYDFVRITNNAQTACGRQLYITLIVGGECSQPTHISDRPPKTPRQPVR